MIDWVPCHANKKMLTDTLRDRFGLDGGYIGSDNENVEFLAHGKRCAVTQKSAKYFILSHQ